MEERDRIDFELLYQLIIDVQNRDLEVDLHAVLEVIMVNVPDHWLIQLFQTEQLN